MPTFTLGVVLFAPSTHGEQASALRCEASRPFLPVTLSQQRAGALTSSFLLPCKHGTALKFHSRLLQSTKLNEKRGEVHVNNYNEEHVPCLRAGYGQRYLSMQQTRTVPIALLSMDLRLMSHGHFPRVYQIARTGHTSARSCTDQYRRSTARTRQ